MKIALPDPRTREGIKTIVQFIVARAVSTTISLIIEKTADPETTYETASVHVGSFVLGEMVGNAAAPTLDGWIDAIADARSAAKAEDDTETTETPEIQE